MNLVERGRVFFDSISDRLARLSGVWILAWVGATVGGAIAMAEVDRLIGRAVAQGENSTVGRIVGPGALGNTDRWQDWQDALGASQYPDLLGRLIGWHVLFDAVFFIGYGVLLWRVIDAAFQAQTPRLRGGYVAKSCLSTLLVAEVAESAFLLLGAVLVNDGVGATKYFIAAAALLKWLALAALVITCVRDAPFRAAVVRAARWIARPLWMQRLSVVVVVLLVALTLLPLPGALDQIPDATRGWISSGRGGIGQLFLAALAYLLAALGLFVVGRRRSERAQEMYGKEATNKKVRPRASILPWMLVPAAVAIIALLLVATGRSRLVDPFVVGLFVAIPWTVAATTLTVRSIEARRRPRTRAILGWLVALILLFGALVMVVLGDPGWKLLTVVPLMLVALSAVVARIVKKSGRLRFSRDDRDSANSVLAQRVRRTGDVLALFVLTIAAASSVRAFTAPVALSVATGRAGRIGFVLALLAGWALLLAFPYLAARLVRARADWFEKLVDDHHRGVDYAVLGGCVLAILAFASYPRGVADHVGVVATAIVAVSAWTLGLGALIVRLQERRPPEVFRMLEMEATPVLTLTALLLIAVSLSGGDPDLHRIRTLSDANIEITRHGLEPEFDAWLARSEKCNRTVPGVGVQVRPIVLVAASGGGIRAAVWTADTMAQVADMGACGKAAVYGSSGVSGGSVGLAVARLLSDPVAGGQSSGAVRKATRRLADPAALSVGMAGTLMGDQLAAATGIRAQLEDGIGNWRDRAGLIEEAWEREIPALKRPYTVDVAGPTGFIVFNSTAAEVKCRVLISQVELGPENAGQGPNCRDADGAPPSAIDFANTLKGCFPDMSWSTAAMLSARFPVVTPSGRIDADHPIPNEPCDADSMQLIDGGYADGEGLATLADIAPALGALIHEHNVGAMESGGTVIVPIVLYLNDEPGVDVVPNQGKAAPEVIVPLVGSGAKSALVGREAWIQRISNSFAAESICPAGNECTEAVKALRPKDAENGAVLTASPPAGPAVEVPLGWTLSKASVDHLEEAVGEAGKACAVDPAEPGNTSDGMIALAALLCLPP